MSSTASPGQNLSRVGYLKSQAATAPASTGVPQAPTLGDADVQAAADAARRAAAAASGRASTILTSGIGATDPLHTTKKTLLGA